MSIMTASAGLGELLGLRSDSAGSPTGVEAGQNWLHIARRLRKNRDSAWALNNLPVQTWPVGDSHAPQRPDTRDAEQRLSATARRAGVRGGHAVCALNSPLVDIFPLSLRRSAADSLEQRVVHQAQKHLGNAIEDTVLDFAVLPVSVLRPGEDLVAVLVFAAPRGLVSRVLRTLEVIGIEAQRFLTPACALAPWVRRTEPGQRCLLLGTGRESTSISVLQDGHVLLERILPWGSHGLIKRLQEELDLEEGQCRMLLAQELALDLDQAGGDEVALPAELPRETVGQVLAPEFQELTLQASRCLGYLNSFFRPAEIPRAIVAGPLASCTPLFASLEDGLDMSVLGPQEGMDLPGPAEGWEAADCMTAACCALWSPEGRP